MDPPSKDLLGHFFKILNITAEYSAQAQSIGTLFEQIGLKRGGLWTCPKVRGTRVRVQAAGRGVSQGNEAAIYPKLTGLCHMRYSAEF